MNALSLHETTHPLKDAGMRFDALVGIDDHKRQLLDELRFLFQAQRVEAWQKKHHASGLHVGGALASASPLVLLAGEVGCGKTALAGSVATPLARAIDAKVVCMETPSDIRGGGRVGEVSQRITEAFALARDRVRAVGHGLLVIDEADDLVTTRAQTQAHHEDRAGVNVMIKQIDMIARDKVPLAVVMITNRYDAIDPAVVRRATLVLHFERPDEVQRRAIFNRMLHGTQPNEAQIAELVHASSPRDGVPFSASDLTVRLARITLRAAVLADEPFDATVLLTTLQTLHPSPMFSANRIP